MAGSKNPKKKAVSKVQEVKRHLDGRVETFDCEPVRMQVDRAVVRFRLPVGSATGPAAP